VAVILFTVFLMLKITVGWALADPENSIEAAHTPVEIYLPAEGGSAQADLRTGEELLIKIVGNPTTGYSWVLTVPGNRDVLRQVGKDTFAPGRAGLGAPGVRQFRFRALSNGVSEIQFVYRRPWEKEKKPLYTATVQIQVSGKSR
jgi:predicted secreted protein